MIKDETIKEYYWYGGIERIQVPDGTVFLDVVFVESRNAFAIITQEPLVSTGQMRIYEIYNNWTNQILPFEPKQVHFHLKSIIKENMIWHLYVKGERPVVS